MQQVYTVSDFIDLVRGSLAENFDEVVVQGEIVDYRPSSQQLVFFDLKDAESRVRCFLLRHELRVELADGMAVQVLGRPALFKKNGGFHIRVAEVSLIGEGALRKAFLMLQQQLSREGLFAAEHKKLIPRFPFNIGLITSSDAAAYTDVLRVLANRFRGLTITLYSVQVQGAGAIRQITAALRHAGNRRDLDVIILTRGGGSLEDLQAFNAEDVARAIFASRIPVVVGVGHERDITIADDVADVRAATPSNAAELVVPDMHDTLLSLGINERRAVRSVVSAVVTRKEAIQHHVQQLAHILTRPTERFRRLHMRLQYAVRQHDASLKQFRGALDERRKLLARAAGDRTHAYTERLLRLTTAMRGLSPQATLSRGYSITYLTEGTKTSILKTARRVRRGAQLKTRLADGTIESRAE